MALKNALKMSPQNDPKRSQNEPLGGAPCRAPCPEAPGSPNAYKTNEKPTKTIVKPISSNGSGR